MINLEIDYEKYGDLFHVNEEHFEKFLSLLTERTLKKSEYFLEFGQTCNHLGFVFQGTLRSFYLNENGIDKSFNFHFTNDFFTNYDSFLQNKPSLLYIQALEDTQVLLLSKENLTVLLKKEQYWQEFRREMSEIMYLESQKRIEDLLYFSPEKRFLNLLDQSPYIFQNVPQKYIASFLGITPQSLSRIKKRISKS